MVQPVYPVHENKDPKEPEREPAVVRALDRMTSNAASLRELIAQLRARLEPVMRTDPEVKEETKRCSENCPLAEEVARGGDFIDESVWIVNDINNRLEI